MARGHAYSFLEENSKPITKGEYELMAKGLKFATPSDNDQFLRGGDASHRNEAVTKVHKILLGYGKWT